MTYKSYPLTGPWKGVVTEIPPPGDPSAFDDMVNFFIKAGRIQTRPAIVKQLTLTDNPPYMAASFSDELGFWHTLIVTQSHAYVLTATPGYALFELTYNLSQVGNFPPALTYPGLSTTNPPFPYSYQYFQNSVFFCNGNFYLSYFNGGTIDVGGEQFSINPAGDVPGGCRYLELDPSGSTLIGANWTEPPFTVGVPGVVGSYNPGQQYPYRIRWCAAGNPQEWNSNVDITAGFADRFDIADYFTGLATLGAITYCLHDKGIVIMYSTGNGIAPYAFEELSQGDSPKTNYYTNTLDKSDQYGFFAGKDDIYALTSGTPEGVGGLDRNQIMKDLGNSNSQNEPTGRVVESLGPGYYFRSFWLNIPGAGKTWVYDIDHGTWQRFSNSLDTSIIFMNEVVTY